MRVKCWAVVDKNGRLVEVLYRASYRSNRKMAMHWEKVTDGEYKAAPCIVELPKKAKEAV